MTTVISGRYQLGQPLGQGGMATVYTAHDTQLGRDVALKLLRADLHNDPAAMERFQREARIAAGFNHHHIARVYDVGVDHAYGPFFVQELVSGQSLDTLLPVPVPQALAWTRELATALAAIHNQGVVHCDVKPQNVRITPEGRAVLLDFGIAQTSGSSGDRMIYGTPQYLAPERAQGAPSTPAADVYALGVLLYELLTGRVPLDGASAYDIVQRHIHEGVPALRQAMPGSAMAIEALISRATQRDPGQRYPSIDALLADLHAVEQTASNATMAMAPTVLRSTVSIHNTPTTLMQPASAVAQLRSAPQPSFAPVAPALPQAAPAGKQNNQLPLNAAHAGQPALIVPPLVGTPGPSKATRNRRWLWASLGLITLLALWLVLRSTGDTQSPAQPAAAATGTPSATATALVTPPLVGLQRDVAQATAQRLGLQLQVTEQVNAAAPMGQIVAQEPVANSPTQPDAVISVVVSNGPATEAPPPEPPSDDGNNDDTKDNGKGKGKGKKDD